MFAAAECAARRAWDVSPNRSPDGHVFVAWYTAKQSSWHRSQALSRWYVAMAKYRGLAWMLYQQKTTQGTLIPLSFPSFPPCPSFPSYFNQFKKNVMMIALVKSMKKAPTSGTMRNARGAAPNLATRARMFATAFAVVPRTKPMNPLAITADS